MTRPMPRWPRIASTGKLSTRPLSHSSSPSTGTGGSTPGTETLASSAWTRLPRRMSCAQPRVTLVATL